MLNRKSCLFCFAAFVALAPAPTPVSAQLADEILTCRAEKKKKRQIQCLEDAIMALKGGGVSAALAANPDATAEPPDAPVASEPAPAAAVPALPNAPETADAPIGLGAEQVIARQAKTSRVRGGKNEERENDVIVAVVDEFAVTPSGTYVFFLDNGQVWRQKRSDSVRIRLSRKRKHEVEIKAGTVSGYRLTIKAMRRKLLVERIK